MFHCSPITIRGLEVPAMTSITKTILPRPVSRRSGFDLAFIPRNRIVKRTLMPWSVHHSLATGKWIATVTLTDHSSHDKLRRIQFSFVSEREAKRFCKSYAPPRFSSSTVCGSCQKTCAIRNCRNCGVTVCDKCSTRWGMKMLPKTYLQGSLATTQRVCISCDWLSNAFCMSLLQGRHQDAFTLYETVSGIQHDYCNCNKAAPLIFELDSFAGKRESSHQLC